MKWRDILLEYRRDKTEQMFGNKIVNHLMTGPDRQLIQVVADNIRSDNAQIDQNAINTELLSRFFTTYAEPADPTRGKIYVPWIAREYGNGNIRRLEDLGTRINPALAKFEMYKRKKDFPPEGKDLMRLNASQFENIIANYEPQEEVTDRGQAQEVFKDQTVRVIVPNDVTAACYYGQGTKWCTAASGHNMFDHYNRQGKMYILLPQQPKYDGEKYQLHFNSSQFMDETDTPVNLVELMTTRFPNLKEFFLQHEPELKETLAFADPATITTIMSSLSEIIDEAVWDELTDWEHNDDSWYDYRVEKAEELGYVDEDGEVDWDAVAEDEELNDYTEYNYEAEQYYKKADKIGKFTLSQILSSEGYEMWQSDHYEESATIRHIPDIIALELKDNNINSPSEYLKHAVGVKNENGEYRAYVDHNAWKNHVEYRKRGRR
jgi:hypothetical protein